MRHMKNQTITILEDIKSGDLGRARKSIDNYRNALSLFEEDKALLRQNIEENSLSANQLIEVKAHLEISDIIDRTIETFFEQNNQIIIKEDGNKELNFKDFDGLIDFSLPKTWNFQIDVIFCHENNRSHFETLLFKRGQKRIIYCSSDYLKISEGIYKTNTASAAECLDDIGFPIPKRICFLDKMFFSKDQNYKNVVEEVSKKLTEFTGHKTTKARFGQAWITNCLNNLHSTLKSTSASDLSKVFTEQNVIIVAPGPSLRKNILELKKESDAIIFAVAQAVPALVEHDITPDFIFVMDPQDYSYTLKSVDHSKVSLICPDYVSRNFVNKPYRKIFTCFSPTSCFNQNIFREMEDFKFENASSVSVGAVQLCHLLGAKRIALVGQDLSFSDEQYYGSFYDPSKIEDENKRPIHKIITLPGYAGGNVVTSFQYSVYHKQLQEYAINNQTSDRKTFYNCSEGGANIPAFENMPLAEFFRSFCKNQKKELDVIDLIAPITIPISNCLSFLHKIKRKNEAIINSIKKLDRLKKTNKDIHEILQIENKILTTSLSTELVKDFAFSPLLKFAESNSMGFTSDILIFQQSLSVEEILKSCQKLNVALNQTIRSLSKASD